MKSYYIYFIHIFSIFLQLDFTIYNIQEKYTHKMKNIYIFIALETNLRFILLIYFNIFLQIVLYKIQEK